MNRNILVSIILPTYNVGKYIGECLDSILAQTYKNLEIIIVDDGSTDDSGVIADEYANKDSRFVVIHQKNAGVSAARNAGINVAKGEYICFADPDDILMPDYVEYLLSLCINNNTEVGVCRHLLSVYRNWQNKEKIEILNGEDAAAEVLYGHIFLGSCNKMFLKDFLNRNNIRFFENLSVGEGFNFNVYAYCFAKRVAVSTHKVYYYRLNNSTSCMTKVNINKVKSALYAFQYMREKLIIKTPKLYRAIDFADWDTHGGMYGWMLGTSAEKENQELFNHCKLYTWKYAFKYIFAPTRLQTRIKALLSTIHPALFPLLMRQISKRG